MPCDGRSGVATAHLPQVPRGQQGLHTRLGLRWPAAPPLTCRGGNKGQGSLRAFDPDRCGNRNTIGRHDRCLQGLRTNATPLVQSGAKSVSAGNTGWQGTLGLFKPA